jgi:hypothetical protein
LEFEGYVICHIIIEYFNDERRKNMIAKVVYVDWRDRKYEPEIVGVYLKEETGLKALKDKERELRADGYGEDEVRVCAVDIKVVE